MSAPFTPGQNARAIRETLSESGTEVVKNAQVTVEAYFGGNQFMARLEGDTGLIFYTADFEPVEPTAPYPAIPAPPLPTQASDDDGREAAPLDPALVKAGDTVVLTRGKAKVEDEVTEVADYSTQGGTVGMTLAHQPREPFWLNAWTLTAHQPAPEPEPEWRPGTLAEATVHGYPGIRVWRVEGGEPLNGWTTHVPVADATWHADSDVTDICELVVIDPADDKFDQDSLAEVARTAYNAAPDVVEWETVANAIRAHLGIEVTR